MEHTDIIIVGAGAAGLMAARELSREGKRVIVLEARDRVGGRVHTAQPGGFSQPIEMGAEFIHGELPLTIKLLQEAGISFTESTGKFSRKEGEAIVGLEGVMEDEEEVKGQLKKLKADMTIAEFFQRYLNKDEQEETRQQIRSFAEGYDAADISKASMMAFGEELQGQEEEPQFRVEGGYGRLMAWLAKQCMDMGCEIVLSAPVTDVLWQSGTVQVTVDKMHHYHSKKVILTHPIGLPQLLVPSIPEKLEAANRLGYGAVIKVSLEFREAFWLKHDKELGFVFSEESIPTWWTQHPQKSNLLTGWLAGPSAVEMGKLSDAAILEHALTSVAAVFEMTIGDVKKLQVAAQVSNWAADPYARGAYTYATVNGNTDRMKLKQPVDNTVFFAGEGVYVGQHTGTVEAALATGLEVSLEVLNGHFELKPGH
jgi:monoamine oxidase